MTVVRYNINTELKKAVQGKKTKAPVGLLLYMATHDYPEIQAGIAKAFSIKRVRF